MKLYSLYFSPTGGTKKVVDIISSSWECEKIDIDLSDSETVFSDISFEKNDLCIVAVPSFSGRVPQFILPHLKAISGNNIKTILIATFGNRAFDDTLIELKNTLDASDFRCISAIAAVTKHSLMPKYGKGRPDNLDVDELKMFAKKCRTLIENIDKNKTADLNVPGNSVYRKYMKVPFIPKANRKCSNCGVCVKKCPVQAIYKNNPKETNSDLCISCLSCVSICKSKARHINYFMQKIAEMKMKKICKTRKKNELFLPI